MATNGLNSVIPGATPLGGPVAQPMPPIPAPPPPPLPDLPPSPTVTGVQQPLPAGAVRGEASVRPSQLTLGGGGVRPEPDTGKTWGGPDSKVELNFGHKPDAQGRLYKLDPSGVPVWGANGKAITPDQWANMPPFQQQAIANLVPTEMRDAFLATMANGVAGNARREKPQASNGAFPGGGWPNIGFNPGVAFDPNVDLAPDARRQMEQFLNTATAASRGRRPDGRCYEHVWRFMAQSGFGAFPKVGIPDSHAPEARMFADLVNVDPARYGLKRLAIDNPYQAPPGAVVVVRAGTPGTAHPTAGDIAVSTGEGWFANGGQMRYGGAQNFPPGNNYVLGIYVPA